MNDATFSRRTSLILVVVCVASFVAALTFALLGPAFDSIESHEANAFSYSAVGHVAFVELLDELDIPVVVSRHRSARKAGTQGVLIEIEPGVQHAGVRPGDGLGRDEVQDLARKCRQAGATLLALPKWRVFEDPKTKGWCSGASTDLDRRADEILEALGTSARVRGALSGDILGAWQTGPFGVTPTLPAPQLLSHEASNIQPLVECGAGILVGEMSYRGRRVLIVSDPDVLANHGLGRGTNALLAVRLVEYLRRGGAAVVDETAHGFIVEPSIWRTLFRFPLVLLSITVVLGLIVLLWTGMGRFGSPQRAPPPLEPGNRFLIQNTSDLLRLGGNAGHALRRYLHATARGVGHALHAPPGLRGRKFKDWLERVEQARGVSTPFERLERDTHQVGAASVGREQRVVAVAMRIQDWKREILHGPASPSSST